MRAAVTGASGHIGANLVRALLARGWSVRVLIHDGDDGVAGLPVERRDGDVTRPETLHGFFDDIDVGFHLAAVISILGDQGGRVPAVNVIGARNVAAAARQAGVGRYVHVSSIHAFCLEDTGSPVDETSPGPGPGQGHYDQSKRAGEDAVRAEIAAGLNGVIVNPTGVLGPQDRGTGRVNRLLSMFAAGLPVVTAGGFNWVDARDVAEGAILAAEKGRVGEGYLLSGTWVSVADLGRRTWDYRGRRPWIVVVPLWLAGVFAPLMDLAGRALKIEPLYTTESLAALRASARISNDKARRELGWAPRPFDETMRDTLDWVMARRARK